MSDPNVLPSPEDPKNAAAELAGSTALSGAVEGADSFAHMFDPNTPDGTEVDPRDPWAAVQTPGKAAAVSPNALKFDSTGMPPAQRTSDRPGYWMPPTEAQIAQNPDLANQNKYYPPGQQS